MITCFMRHLSRKSMVYKAILVNCIFVLFAMIFLAYNNIYIKSALKKEYTRNTNYVNYMSSTLESEINYVKRLMLTCSFDKNVGSISKIGQKDRLKSNTTFNIWKAIDTIRILKNNSDIILDLYLYLPKTGLVINSQGSIQADIFFNNIINYENINILENLPASSEFKTFYGANAIYQRQNNKKLNTMIYIYPISNNDGFVYVSIDKSRVNNLIADLTDSNLGKDSISIITDSEGEIVGSSVNQQAIEKLGINFKELVLDDEGIVRLKAADYYGVKGANKDSAYQWLVLFPSNPMAENIKKINIYTLWSIAIFILITISVSFIQNIGIFIPVEKLVGKLKIDLNSRENEYKTLRNHHNFITSKCADMEIRMVKQKYLIENGCYTGIFSGVVDERDRYIKAEIDEINRNMERYAVIKNVIEDKNGKKPLEMIDIFEKMLLKKFIFKKVYSGKKEDVYIINVESYEKSIERLKSIYACMNKEYGAYALAGISSVFSDINLLKTAYAEADTAINQGLGKQDYIIEYSSKNIGKLDHLDFRIDDEQELSYNVLNGCIKRVENILRTKFFTKMDIPLKQKKDVFSYLVTTLKFLVNSQNIEFKQVFDEDYLDIIDKINNIYNSSTSMLLVKEYYIKTTQIMLDRMSSKEHQIIDYVNKNYNKDLYLELLAEEFDIAPGYMSAYFKKITGKHFLSYLQTIRINKAKEMLVRGDKKIYEIANEVGYKDVSNFITNFKALMGTSPGQYKKGLFAALSV